MGRPNYIVMLIAGFVRIILLGLLQVSSELYCYTYCRFRPNYIVMLIAGFKEAQQRQR